MSLACQAKKLVLVFTAFLLKTMATSKAAFGVVPIIKEPLVGLKIPILTTNFYLALPL